ncbi:hypothetical protein OAQ99_03285 [Candidatus Kapabacteria bacterium]|nr:hypothetical protein [Candidatus Kapabacteria bacterium]
MQRLILLGIISIFFLTNCKKEDSRDPISRETQNTIDVPLGTGQVDGQVFDEAGNGISGVTVFAGTVSSITDSEGKFLLDGIGNSDLVPVTFEKAGFVSTQKIVQTKDDMLVSVEAALSLVGNVTNIGINGGVADHNGLEVEFPKNAFVNELGQEFQGNAEVRTTWFNPTSDQFLNMFPGNFEGEREDGTTTSIESFGFIDVEIWAGSQKLNLADGKTASIKVPVPNEIKNRAPQTIPLWHYDMNQAKWIEDGAASLEGDFYVGEVSHFTRWNCDVPQTVSFIEGYVVNENGQDLAHARIVANGVDYTGYTQAYTDENGYFKISVRENSEVTIIASHGGWFSEVIGVFTPSSQTTKEIPNIIIFKKEVQQPGWYQTNDFNVNYTIGNLSFSDSDNGVMTLINDQVGTLEFFDTQDGGENWNKMSEVPYQSGRDSTLYLGNYDLSKNNVSIIVGYQSYITVDGGKSWAALQPPTPSNRELFITDVEVVDNKTIYVLITKYDKNQLYYSLYSSDNFGDSWDFVSDIDNASISNNTFGLTSNIFKMIDSNTGYIWNQDEIIKTVDGGVNWTKISDNPSKSQPKELIFFNDFEGLLLSDDGIYNTQDGGQTWTIKQASTTINGKYEINDNQIWVLSQGIIYYSNDKGQSWAEQTYSPEVTLNAIAFKNAVEGYAGGTGGFVIKTETAGNK